MIAGARGSENQRRQLIVTADDFGMAPAVNMAVEQAHRDGILTCASLMVTGDAAADAVARARTMPRLGVGLHLMLVEGRPALPPERVSHLIDASGHFRRDMARAGLTIFARPAARRQLFTEVEAQFAAFAATGLTLDHVNAHKHFHLHPTITSAVLAIGPRYGMRAVRAPVEPRRLVRRLDRSASAIDIADPWARLVRQRLRRRGLMVPDRVFGLAWTGAMTRARLEPLVRNLPAGVTEIYTHPATEDAFDGSAPGYRYRAELAALCDDRVRAAADAVERGRFLQFTGAAGASR